MTVLRVQITGITCVSTGLSTLGRTYWTYAWTEIGPFPDRVLKARNNQLQGDAVNEHELSFPNNGGNVVPATATLTRLRIPNGAIVPLILDDKCLPWFFVPNPLQVACI
jgi:hypothetical protein